MAAINTGGVFENYESKGHLNQNYLSPREVFLKREIGDITSYFEEIALELPQRILVTGAGGFLGQWILAALAEYTIKNSKLDLYCQTNRFGEIESNWNIANRVKIHTPKSEMKFDLIFDCYLPSTGPTYEEQLRQAREFFSSIARNFEQLSIGGRLIHPSSGAVYGDLKFTDVLCEDLKVKPGNLSIYGNTKVEIESLLGAFSANDRQLLTPRIFSVFGPLMREDSPLIGNTFIQKAIRGEKIIAVKSGNVFRDFAYVADIVKQIVMVASTDISIKNINLGSNNIAEIAEFGELISENSGVVFEKGDFADPVEKYFGCLHNLRKVSEYQKLKETNLENSIKKTLQFYMDT